MPLIDGEKFACTSCIKGHRVSGCNHTDRELHHINPKGRPVKQCEHCRGARKSKSHHAKCDCGDKKDKIKNKDDAKGELGASCGVGAVSNDATAHSSRCACHSGGKCLCGIKKETPGLRLDTSRQTLHDMRARPKVTATHSESNLTVFANGHHKPCHRNNNSAHISGLPYQLSRPHSLHGTPAFASLAQGNNNYNPVELSRDTHSLVNNDFHTAFGSTPRSTDILPLTPVTGSLDSSSFQDSFQENFQDSFQDALFTGQSSTFGQGGNSPTESHLSETLAGPWPWAVNPNFPYDSLSTSPSQSQEFLPALENEWAIPSAGLANPSWSAGDLPLDPSKLSDNLMEPISHSGESKQSAPGLTTTSSSPSELGDPVLFGDFDLKAPVSTASESLFWEDSPVYRVAPPSTNESRAPTSVPQRSTPESQGLDLQYPKTATTSSAPSLYSDATAIAMPNSVDDVPPSAPWMMNQQPRVYPSSIYATFGLPATFNSWR
ncbi:hypothetical protein K458DRAFT_98004 [Lentithecium fluviatile CBS 122367]|uniref:Copper-fist domain-containing protein n=1 Tax=Lentithecium fluviatile CBS 122367 TaxID=1168545 RepID=A0A6G1JHI4_9PLEO|nr:hypothetical protein K458DRAFT_98004 [Lentithecium fluviatile CBS 122367]